MHYEMRYICILRKTYCAFGYQDPLLLSYLEQNVVQLSLKKARYNTSAILDDKVKNSAFISKHHICEIRWSLHSRANCFLSGKLTYPVIGIPTFHFCAFTEMKLHGEDVMKQVVPRFYLLCAFVICFMLRKCCGTETYPLNYNDKWMP